MMFMALELKWCKRSLTEAEVIAGVWMNEWRMCKCFHQRDIFCLLAFSWDANIKWNTVAIGKRNIKHHNLRSLLTLQSKMWPLLCVECCRSLLILHSRKSSVKVHMFKSWSSHMTTLHWYTEWLFCCIMVVILPSFCWKHKIKFFSMNFKLFPQET